jgi:murein DD-endopeptidase MepM/ murein hydrolase activator NlpD
VKPIDTLLGVVSDHARRICRWYAGIFFSSSLFSGACFCAATLWSPDFGLSALFCAYLMFLWGRVFDVPEAEIAAGPYCANGLLFGLFVGHTFTGATNLLLINLLGGFLVFLLCRVFTQILAIRWLLPVCSYPFVVAVFLFSFIGASQEARLVSPLIHPLTHAPTGIDAFFHRPYHFGVMEKAAREVLMFVYSTGAVFFQGKFWPCLLATVGLLTSSHLMSLIALFGYAVMRGLCLCLPFVTTGQEVFLGFNAILIAMALGGTFFVPGTRTALLVICAQGAGVAVSLGALAFTRSWGGLWTTLPFNLVVSGALLMLQGRGVQAKPMRPGMAFETPEEAVVYYRRYEERIFLRGTALPVFGRWQIVQAFDGHETHKGYWRFGVDLAAVDEDSKRFRSTGAHLEDYYAYNAPVLSPVEGVVSAVWGEVADNSLGDMNLPAPWGNFVIIYSQPLYFGMYHLKQGSIQVTAGQYVTVGTPIGRVGNSGRSALPHLHFQVQAYPDVGAQNLPFLFTDVLVEEQHRNGFHPFFKPLSPVVVSNLPQHESNRLLFFPKNGGVWRFEKIQGKEVRQVTWTFSYTVFGNVIVTADDGDQIEYRVAPKSVETVRFSSHPFSGLGLFGLSIADLPLHLVPGLRWQTVLFGRPAYRFLNVGKKILSWFLGDIFSSLCYKETFDTENSPEESSRTEGVKVITWFSPAAQPGHGDVVEMTWDTSGLRKLRRLRGSQQVLCLKRVLTD